MYLAHISRPISPRRAFCPPGRTCSQKKFDPNKRVQTGSVTTYWKLAARLTGPNPNPNPGPNTGPKPNPNSSPNLTLTLPLAQP